MNKKNTYLPLTELIDELQKSGFIIGVDTLFNLQKVLDAIDLQTEYDNLHEYLCPVFATNQKEQHLFYDIYFRVIHQQKMPQKTHKQTTLPKTEEQQAETIEIIKPKRSKLYIAATLAAIIVTVAIVWTFWNAGTQDIKQKSEILTEKTEELNREIKSATDTIDKINEQKEKYRQKKDSIEKIQENIEKNKPKKTPKDDSLKKQQEKLEQEKRDFEFRLLQNDSLAEQKTQEKAKKDSLIAQKNKQKELYDKQKRQINLEYARYALLAILLIVFGFWMLYDYITRKLIAQSKHKRKPPDVWNIHIDNSYIEEDPDIFSVANSMRFRTQGRVRNIDIIKTIEQTVKNAGIPRLEYKHNTKPIEYLMLIDWSNHGNHQAQLFDYLYRTFVNNNVYIERFYYDTDPRLCWNNTYAQGITIQKLQLMLPDAYLLIFGNGAKFVHPMSNTPLDFTAIFTQWQRRALLTPEPSAHWGVREVALRKLFEVILPANTEGMVELTEHFNIKSGEASDLKEWKFDPRKKKHYLIVDAQTLEKNSQITKQLKIWIAACALYPELYWDLTIEIGKKLETTQDKKIDFENLVSRKNLDILARIDWFRTGKIPEQQRQLLLRNQNLLPDKYRKIALNTIIDVLQQNINNQHLENTGAERRFLMNIVVSKLMLKNTNNKERKKLQNQLKQLTHEVEEQDFVALEYIDRNKKQITDFLMPEKFKKHFYNKGYKLLGLKNSIRYAALIIGIVAIFLIKNPLITDFFKTIKPDKTDIANTDTAKNDIPDDTTDIANTDTAKNDIPDDTTNRPPLTPPVTPELNADNTEFYKAQDKNTIEAYNNYLNKFENPKHRQKALQAIDLLKQQNETADWQNTKTISTEKAYTDFLRKYPQTIKKDSANMLIARIKEAQAWQAAISADKPCKEIDKYKQLAFADTAKANRKKAELKCGEDTAPDLKSIIAQIENNMVKIQGGTFKIGSNDGDDDEKNGKDITISTFSMSKFEVTIEQYMAFVEDTKGNYPEWLEKGNSQNINENGSNKDYYRTRGMSLEEKDKRKPITGVSWNNADAFCKWLSQKTGKKYSLPTEAQWEYAARGGVETHGRASHKYAGSNNIDEVAWYSDNSGSKTHPVGTKSPNQLGIYDMSGNVWEWCLDWYDSDYYKNSPQKDPVNTAKASNRVNRGGSWSSSADFCRVAIRDYDDPTNRNSLLGFRLVLLP